MSTLQLNRNEQQTADQNLIDGLTSRQQTIPSFVIGGTSFKTADIITSLQGRIKTASTAVSTRAAWQTAVKADQDERAKTRPIVSGVRQTLQVMFAGQIDVLAEFGLKPRKPKAALTPEEKAAVVAKSKATRKARNTLGSKQKAKIKGSAPQAAPLPSPVATASAVPSPAAPTPPASAVVTHSS